jgi:hypothetical protein
VGGQGVGRSHILGERAKKSLWKTEISLPLSHVESADPSGRRAAVLGEGGKAAQNSNRNPFFGCHFTGVHILYAILSVFVFVLQVEGFTALDGVCRASQGPHQFPSPPKIGDQYAPIQDNSDSRCHSLQSPTCNGYKRGDGVGKFNLSN